MKGTKKMPWENHVFIIAEAGVNHNGHIGTAKRLIEQAANVEADAVKFQTWRPNEIVGAYSHKVNYLKKATGTRESFSSLLDRLCLSFEAFRELKKHAKKNSIQFMSTPDGTDSLDFLVNQLSIPIIKIGSTEVTNTGFLKSIAAKHRPMILSTGLSSLGEVEKAINVIRRMTDAPLVLLHCTSEYPAPDTEINVKAMVTMKNAFNLPVGLSDHSKGSEAAIAAVALGAVVIEKHFTLNRMMSGPDHRASMSPKEMRNFILSIRKTEKMLGDGIKRITPSEQNNIQGIRRSVVASRSLKRGTVLRKDMLVCKRPGTGLTPDCLETVIGMRLTTSVNQDEPLQWKYFK